MKRKRSFVLSLLALVLILCACIQPAWAYFTSSKQADGAVKLSFKRTTTITEYVDESLTKHVTVSNTGDSEVWVRAKAYAGSLFTLNVNEGNGWTGRDDGDGLWYYYSEPVDPGKSTGELLVQLIIPDDVNPPDDVNVGVVYESTAVIYNANGSYKTVDWSAPLLDSATSEPIS